MGLNSCLANIEIDRLDSLHWMPVGRPKRVREYEHPFTLEFTNASCKEKFGSITVSAFSALETHNQNLSRSKNISLHGTDSKHDVVRDFSGSINRDQSIIYSQ